MPVGVVVCTLFAMVLQAGCASAPKPLERGLGQEELGRVGYITPDFEPPIAAAPTGVGNAGPCVENLVLLALCLMVLTAETAHAETLEAEAQLRDGVNPNAELWDALSAHITRQDVDVVVFPRSLYGQDVRAQADTVLEASVEQFRVVRVGRRVDARNGPTGTLPSLQERTRREPRARVSMEVRYRLVAVAPKPGSPLVLDEFTCDYVGKVFAFDDATRVQAIKAQLPEAYAELIRCAGKRWPRLLSQSSHT